MAWLASHCFCSSMVGQHGRREIKDPRGVGWRTLHTESEREHHARRARGACIGVMFLGPRTYRTVKCMYFQAVKGVTIARTALCPLTVSPTLLSWRPVSIAVTHT